MIEQRPWGYFKVLYASESMWLKELVIDAGQRLSAQRHRFRREVWVPRQSGGLAIIEEQTLDLHEGIAYDVPVGAVHRIYNNTDEPIVIMEWATGNPQESDIERLDDDYGR